MAVVTTARGPTWLLLAAALPFILMFAIRPVRSAPVYDDEHQLATHSEDSGCYYNYQHYGEGDRIITNEPCLNCTCHNRMLMCYLRVCPFTKAIGQDCKVEKKADQCCPVITCPEVPVTLLSHPTPSTTSRPLATSSSTQVGYPDSYGCTIDSDFYADGAQVPNDANKPCELCYCIRNRTACVMQECTLNVEGCKPVYEDGVCCPVRYECDYPEDPTTAEYGGGLILTTTTTSPNLACRYNDDEFSDGALIHMDDKPCEHCYCMRGDIVCAVQECGTPLAKEGKNCTALPPQPGKCCPEMYQCDSLNEPTTAAPQKVQHDSENNQDTKTEEEVESHDVTDKTETSTEQQKDQEEQLDNSTTQDHSSVNEHSDDSLPEQIHHDTTNDNLEIDSIVQSSEPQGTLDTNEATTSTDDSVVHHDDVINKPEKGDKNSESTETIEVEDSPTTTEFALPIDVPSFDAGSNDESHPIENESNAANQEAQTEIDIDIPTPYPHASGVALDAGNDEEDISKPGQLDENSNDKEPTISETSVTDRNEETDKITESPAAAEDSNEQSPIQQDDKIPEQGETLQATHEQETATINNQGADKITSDNEKESNENVPTDSTPELLLDENPSELLSDSLTDISPAEIQNPSASTEANIEEQVTDKVVPIENEEHSNENVSNDDVGTPAPASNAEISPEVSGQTDIKEEGNSESGAQTSQQLPEENHTESFMDTNPEIFNDGSNMPESVNELTKPQDNLPMAEDKPVDEVVELDVEITTISAGTIQENEEQTDSDVNHDELVTENNKEILNQHTPVNAVEHDGSGINKDDNLEQTTMMNKESIILGDIHTSEPLQPDLHKPVNTDAQYPTVLHDDSDAHEVVTPQENLVDNDKTEHDDKLPQEQVGGQHIADLMPIKLPTITGSELHDAQVPTKNEIEVASTIEGTTEQLSIIDSVTSPQIPMESESLMSEHDTNVGKEPETSVSGKPDMEILGDDFQHNDEIEHLPIEQAEGFDTEPEKAPENAGVALNAENESSNNVEGVSITEVPSAIESEESHPIEVPMSDDKPVWTDGESQKQPETFVSSTVIPDNKESMVETNTESVNAVEELIDTVEGVTKNPAESHNVVESDQPELSSVEHDQVQTDDSNANEAEHEAVLTNKNPVTSTSSELEVTTTPAASAATPLNHMKPADSNNDEVSNTEFNTEQPASSDQTYNDNESATQESETISALEPEAPTGQETEASTEPILETATLLPEKIDQGSNVPIAQNDNAEISEDHSNNFDSAESGGQDTVTTENVLNFETATDSQNVISHEPEILHDVDQENSDDQHTTANSMNIEQESTGKPVNTSDESEKEVVTPGTSEKPLIVNEVLSDSDLTNLSIPNSEHSIEPSSTTTDSNETPAVNGVPMKEEMDIVHENDKLPTSTMSSTDTSHEQNKDEKPMVVHDSQIPTKYEDNTESNINNEHVSVIEHVTSAQIPMESDSLTSDNSPALVDEPINSHIDSVENEQPETNTNAHTGGVALNAGEDEVAPISHDSHGSLSDEMVHDDHSSELDDIELLPVEQAEVEKVDISTTTMTPIVEHGQTEISTIDHFNSFEHEPVEMDDIEHLPIEPVEEQNNDNSKPVTNIDIHNDANNVQSAEDSAEQQSAVTQSNNENDKVPTTTVSFTATSHEQNKDEKPMVVHDSQIPTKYEDITESSINEQQSAVAQSNNENDITAQTTLSPVHSDSHENPIPSVIQSHIPSSHPAMQDAEETNPDHYEDDMMTEPKPDHSNAPDFRPEEIPEPQISTSNPDLMHQTEIPSKVTTVIAEEDQKHPNGKPESDLTDISFEDATESSDEVTNSPPTSIEELPPTPFKPDVIPGEGSCMVDGKIFASGSVIPVANPCQDLCKCQNSIVHCSLKSCPSPPSNNPDCMPMYKEGSCCPAYTCVDVNGQVVEQDGSSVHQDSEDGDISEDSITESSVGTSSNLNENLNEQEMHTEKVPSFDGVQHDSDIAAVDVIGSAEKDESELEDSSHFTESPVNQAAIVVSSTEGSVESNTDLSNNIPVQDIALEGTNSEQSDSHSNLIPIVPDSHISQKPEFVPDNDSSEANSDSNSIASVEKENSPGQDESISNEIEGVTTVIPSVSDVYTHDEAKPTTDDNKETHEQSSSQLPIQDHIQEQTSESSTPGQEISAQTDELSTTDRPSDTEVGINGSHDGIENNADNEGQSNGNENIKSNLTASAESHLPSEVTTGNSINSESSTIQAEVSNEEQSPHYDSKPEIVADNNSPVTANEPLQTEFEGSSTIKPESHGETTTAVQDSVIENVEHDANPESADQAAVTDSIFAAVESDEPIKIPQESLSQITADVDSITTETVLQEVEKVEITTESSHNALEISDSEVEQVPSSDASEQQVDSDAVPVSHIDESEQQTPIHSDDSEQQKPIDSDAVPVSHIDGNEQQKPTDNEAVTESNINESDQQKPIDSNDSEEPKPIDSEAVPVSHIDGNEQQKPADIDAVTESQIDEGEQQKPVDGDDSEQQKPIDSDAVPVSHIDGNEQQKPADNEAVTESHTDESEQQNPIHSDDSGQQNPIDSNAAPVSHINENEQQKPADNAAVTESNIDETEQQKPVDGDDSEQQKPIDSDAVPASHIDESEPQKPIHSDDSEQQKPIDSDAVPVSHSDGIDQQKPADNEAVTESNIDESEQQKPIHSDDSEQPKPIDSEAVPVSHFDGNDQEKPTDNDAVPASHIDESEQQKPADNEAVPVSHIDQSEQQKPIDSEQQKPIDSDGAPVSHIDEIEQQKPANDDTITESHIDETEQVKPIDSDAVPVTHVDESEELKPIESDAMPAAHADESQTLHPLTGVQEPSSVTGDTNYTEKNPEFILSTEKPESLVHSDNIDNVSTETTTGIELQTEGKPESSEQVTPENNKPDESFIDSVSSGDEMSVDDKPAENNEHHHDDSALDSSDKPQDTTQAIENNESTTVNVPEYSLTPIHSGEEHKKPDEDNANSSDTAPTAGIDDTNNKPEYAEDAKPITHEESIPENVESVTAAIEHSTQEIDTTEQIALQTQKPGTEEENIKDKPEVDIHAEIVPEVIQDDIPKPVHNKPEHQSQENDEVTTSLPKPEDVNQEEIKPISSHPENIAHPVIKPDEIQTDAVMPDQEENIDDSDVNNSEVMPQYPDPVLPDMEDEDEQMFEGFPGQPQDPGSEFLPPMPSYEEEDHQNAFGPGTCRYGGKVYVSAQQIPRDDPCDFCFCFRSDIICLQQSCPPPIRGCHEETIEGFCCPRYECPVPMGLKNATTTTTTTTTLPPDLITSYVYGRQTSSGCLVQGQLYNVGDEITTASGPCLECRCGGNSKMQCEPKACSPQPLLRKMIEAVSLRR